MLFVLKSISLPILLVSGIELAILINMAISYYTGDVLPFVASIVIGTIQLGATIDYAILLTTKYLENRSSGLEKYQLWIMQFLLQRAQSLFQECHFLQQRLA